MENEIKPLEPQKPVESKPKKTPLSTCNTVFFTLSCVATGIIVFCLIIPVILFLFGVMSAIVWFVFIFAGSVFTLGLMWLSDDTKKFNQGWMDFNNKMFNAGNSVYEVVAKVVPYIVIVGAIIINVELVFLILGWVKDKPHKKKYLAFTIVLGILTLAYIVVAIFAIRKVIQEAYPPVEPIE